MRAVSGTETNKDAGPGTSTTISVTYNLANFEGDNNWFIEVPVFGNAIETGDYTIQFTMAINEADDSGGVAEASSKVIDFDIRDHLWYWADNLHMSIRTAELRHITQKVFSPDYSKIGTNKHLPPFKLLVVSQF